MPPALPPGVTLELIFVLYPVFPGDKIIDGRLDITNLDKYLKLAPQNACIVV